MNTKILTYDGFLTMVDNHELFINRDKIMTFINGSENVKKYHKHLCKHFNRVLTKKSDQLIQSGGDPTTIFVILGSIGLVLAVGYFIMKMTKPSQKCKSEYKILQEDQYPTTIEFLEKIVPISWLGDTDNSEKAIYNLTHKLDSLSNVLNFIDTDSSVIKSIGVNLLRITSSIALDVATLGAGGDIIISLLFTFKSVIDLIGTIVTHLNDIINDTSAMRLLYDILNVNFSGGPFHVKCWIKYILREYGSDTPAFQTVCKFFRKIFDKLANFMGNALGAMIPDSIGIPGILIPMLIKNFKAGSINIIEAQINKYYKKIPFDMKLMLSKPHLFKKFLDRKIKKSRKYLMNIGNNIFDTLLDNTWAFSYSIHKFFALMFSLFYILKLCFNEQ